jgi:hypothetical protein
MVISLWTKASRRPVDTFAILTAVAASLIIIVNAVLWQSGSHPAPFFAPPKSAPVATNVPPNPAAPAAPAHPAAATVVAQPIAARRNDPIADLIGSPSRVIVVQRVLSDFGYGQIRPSGILDEQTSAAIEKFEREHKLPVTGRLSDRLLSGLAVMAGRPLD